MKMKQESHSKKILNILVNILLFIAGVALVVINQKTVGVSNLLLMFLGVGILFFLIWKYNRLYT